MSSIATLVRLAVRAVLGVALRVFFSVVEVAGSERLPSDGPIIFVLNHPNSLVDPLFLLCLAPRRVSFLAKAPLFRMPLVGMLVQALDSLPVYRRQDQADTRQNLETFARARAILQRGGAIAIFPEGTTHSDPRLRPVKTGAARIALGAALRLYVVPTGLYYTDKRLFRSKALAYFGEPILVEPENAAGDPPREDVRALSERIRDGLLEVTLNADEAEALAWIERAHKVFSESSEVAEPGTLAREFEMRRRFLDGYGWYATNRPDRLEALERRIEAYEARARVAGIAPDSLSRPAQSLPGYVARNLLVLAALLVPATVGALAHWPLYRLVGTIARLGARNDTSVVSTIKMGTSILFFPLLWIGLGIAADWLGGTSVGVAAGLLAPLCGMCAVLFGERLQRMRDTLAPHFLARDLREQLSAERAATRADITRLGEEQGR